MPHRRSDAAQRGDADRASILIVDDTIENLRLLVNMLERNGYEARPATSGRQALQAVENAPADLVLLDINMPEMDGFEVCRRLKRRDEMRDIPVLFLSALSSSSDKVRGFEAGGVDYITKPFQVEEVLARVQTHLSLRRARTELAQSYERLRGLEEMRDNLVHMVAHDIRSPLAVVTGTLDLLLVGAMGPLSEKVKEELRAVQHSAREITLRVRDLLDVRRLEDRKMPIERTRCDLVQIASGVRESLTRVTPGRRIDLEAGGPVEVDCDAALMQRVFENLVGNGIRHTPREGRVEIVLTSGNGRVRAMVRDEGPGIPAEAREEIFEVFGTVRARAEHTYHSVGLGLAYCKLAVEAHGGTIGVDSGENGGSTFWFELPS